MTVAYIGELSIGAMIPLPVTLAGQSLFQLQAQLDATIAMSANLQLPSSILDLIALAESILHALEQMLALGLGPPTLTIQTALIAQTILTLQLQLAPFLLFQTLCGTAGVFAYVYDGTTAGAGAELTTALSGGFPGHSGGDHCDMLVMGTVASATWTAMQAVFRTS